MIVEIERDYRFSCQFIRRRLAEIFAIFKSIIVVYLIIIRGNISRISLFATPLPYEVLLRERYNKYRSENILVIRVYS